MVDAEGLFERFKFFFKKRGYFKELESPYYLSRALAAGALGDMKYPKAVPALIEKLQDEHPRVRLSAAEALGEIGDERAVVPLIGMLEDKDVQKCAVRALGKIGGPKAGDVLTEKLRDPCLCEEAAEALVHLAAVTDIDLIKVAESLQLYGKRVKVEADLKEIWTVEEIKDAESLVRTIVKMEGSEVKEKARIWIVETYRRIAKAVAERRGKQMPGEMLGGKIRPPKKGIYRMRRATNG